VLERTDDSVLCRTIWDPEVRGFHEILSGEGATLLDAEGENEEWLFRMRFPNREATSRFREACDERGLSYDVRRIYSLSELPARQHDLTDEQREALVAAFEAGYFRVPRDVSLSELAEDLDISPQAASGRLRRGLERVLASALFPRGDPEETPDGT
jgi:predicted DNA binding protein